MGTSILTIAIIVFILLRLIAATKKRTEVDIKKSMVKQRPPQSHVKDPVFESYPKEKHGGIKKSSSGSIVLKDDRNGDWLANQMREERRSLYRMSEMFGLKIQHESNCDAYALKKEHLKHCDADRIDSARPSN